MGATKQAQIEEMEREAAEAESEFESAFAGPRTIVGHPWEFARKWYDVDEIHRSLTRAESMRQLGDLPPVPTDVYSREFAEWLAEQYRLAMLKGAELTAYEMKNRIRELESHLALTIEMKTK